MSQDGTPQRPGTPMPVDPDVFAPMPAPRVRRWDIALVIGVGGALGGGARWLVNQAMPTPGGGFPWATLVENVSGAFLLSVVMVFLVDVFPPHRYARPFVGIGVLGGFTTFSTYTSDTRVLLGSGQGPAALAYLLGSVAAGLVAVVIGLALTRRLTGVTRPARARRNG